MLHVWLLGQFQVRVDNQRVTIPSRAAQSLLAYLILTAGTPHRREKLAGMLSPEMTEENARNNFRHELWRLRKALTLPETPAAEYLVSEGFTLTFNPSADYWFDVAQLERSPETDDELGDLIGRLALYRGDLLPGFYDDWVGPERDRVRALFESRMGHLLRRLIVEERWQTAIEWAERWISRGHTPEEAYRALMLAHSAQGETGKIGSDYERCAEALRADMDIEPSAETQALYAELTRGAERIELRSAPLSNASASRQRDSDVGSKLPAPGEPPFKGLEFFDQADADLFFGREAIVARLVQSLEQYRSLVVVIGASGSGKSSLVRAGLLPALKNGTERTASNGRGPEAWRVHVMTPTAHPLEALAIELTRDSESVTAAATLTDDLNQDPRALHLYLERMSRESGRNSDTAIHPLAPRRGRVLLVLDQFEELFTLCHNDLEREQFIDNLVYASNRSSATGTHSRDISLAGPLVPDSSLTLILTLRADFYAHIAQYPELRALIARHQEYIGPMSVEELRRAIEEPALHRRAADGSAWEFEGGLVDLILRDVGNEPGALPLLSHALLETWKRRSGHRMTLRGYQDSGGVRSAIAQTAETTYEQLDPARQVIARSIFLRLTQLGEGTEDTRRRTMVQELVRRPQDAENVMAVLNVLARARLITLSWHGLGVLSEFVSDPLVAPPTHDKWQGSVEVAHEALIREWGRLRGWLNEDREGLRLHRQLTDAAQEWQLMERDASALYRGARLVQAEEFAANNPDALNAQERAFLEQSELEQERAIRERQQQQQRELETAQTLAETQTRAAKQLKRRALVLAAAFLLAAFLAGLALLLGNQAASNAATAQQKAQEALAQQNIAGARELAASAMSNLSVDPERSILLALQSISITHGLDNTVMPEAENALHQALSASRLQMTLREHSGPTTAVAYAPDGTRIATASLDGSAKIWDAATGKSLFTLRGHAGVVNDIVFSPDGTRLATASSDNTAKLWDTASGHELLTLRGHSTGSSVGVTGSVFGVAFSPDGTRVATTGSDLTIRVWDSESGVQVRGLFGLPGWAYRISFDPTGLRIAAGFNDGISWVLDVDTGDRVLFLFDHNAEISSIGYSPDGKRIITADKDGIVKVWDAATGSELFKLSGHNTAVRRAAYSADGKRIATASYDGTIKIWDADSGTELFTLYGHSAGVNDVAFSPDCVAPPEHPFAWCSTRVATASNDETVKIWDVSPFGSRELLTLPGIAGVFHPDGNRFVTVSSFDHNTVREQVWDISKPIPQEMQNFSLGAHSDRLVAVGFDASITQIATGGADSRAKLWDISTGENIATFTLPRASHGIVSSLGFSSDGQEFFAGGSGHRAIVWDSKSGSELFSLSAGRADVSVPAVTAVAIRPDGQHIVTADSVNGIAQIWNITTGELEQTLEGHKSAIASIAFSPAGDRIATGSFDGTAKIWNAETGQELVTLAGHLGGVQSVAFNPDGTLLVTGSLDATAKLWNVASGREWVTFTGQIKPITQVAFSADGTRLAVSSMDGTVKLYTLELNDLVKLARERLTRSWTPEECQKFLHTETCPPESKE